MPFAFSTLGLPGQPLDAVLALAAEHGWQGLELRAAPGEPVHTGLSSAERRAAARQFASAAVTPLTVASYVGIAEPGPDAPVRAELLAHLHLAADLGAPYVRVFPRGGDDPAEGAQTAARRLRELAGTAADLGVTVLVETHDSHRSGAALAALLAEAPHPAVGALWDVLHTWLAGETPADSHRLLARASATSRSRTSPPPRTSPRSRSARASCPSPPASACSPPAPGSPGSTRRPGTPPPPPSLPASRPAGPT
ncbi:hypothetical protein KCH_19190 [Kitasatospora cheerisanensis KCTC 2395]|uniref:Xylose isomerase-like TIM barrel domain-containing protein n=1 Tax=Kitasatospora cheerisanensis KCTC 2395 TaxID=1348663 RepID=A0A066YXZ5_9ACTN|nr:hypothetical protein KCH_19190 [Kitasatospora cheerisanensis KCTC 2395]